MRDRRIPQDLGAASVRDYAPIIKKEVIIEGDRVAPLATRQRSITRVGRFREIRSRTNPRSSALDRPLW
jgi:hypothetical protein